MILADKIIRSRKKNGWSQEELAEKMNVSRQAVSKWESAQSIPDLDKILQLSTLFGVSTDYLLKDEIECEEIVNDNSLDTNTRRISIEEANAFIQHSKKSSFQIAIATFLCIISPITLIILTVFSQQPNAIFTEITASVIGLIILFVFILCAIPIYIYCGFKNQPYDFLEKNVPFDLEYGVKGILTEKKNAFKPKYVALNIIATVTCIFAVLLLVLLSFTKDDIIIAFAIGLLLFFVAIGVGIFIVVGIQNESMQKLLKEGEFTEKEKKRTKVKDAVSVCYWGFLTATYLGISFISNNWDLTWLVFAIGGILFPVVIYISNYFADKRNKD